MKTVAIVGSHTATRSDAPFDDESIDIWVFNEAATTGVRDEYGVLHRWARRVSAVFQLHSPTIYRNPNNRSDPGHWAWLQEQHEDITIYMQARDPLVPDSAAYPLAEVLGLCGNVTLRAQAIHYLTSTIAMAIGLAILRGYERILLYGIEMNSDTEYAYQRDCVAFWVGMAAGRGAIVELHCADDIFDRLLYGYESDIYQHPEQLDARGQAISVEIQPARDRLQAAERAWLAQMDKQVVDPLALEEWLNAARELGQLEGAKDAAWGYVYEATNMVAETGRAHIDRIEFEASAHASLKAANNHLENMYRTAGRIDLVVKSWQEKRVPALLRALQQLAADHVQAGYEYGYHHGKSQENFRLMADLDRRIQAAGGAKAAELLH